MKTILITCLKDNYSLISAGQVLASLKRSEPSAEVHILTFKDLENASKIVNGARKIHFIDRYKIEHLMSGALYSDAFAINSFVDDINEVLDIEWDEVLNLSNDEVSAYLCPMLTTKKVVGSSVSTHGTVRTSDRWASYRNFYAAGNLKAPISEITCALHSLGTPEVFDATQIKLNEEFTMVANQNFARIRSSKGEGETHIVGINLVDGKDGSLYDMPFLVDLVETLESSVEYKAVLLVSGANTDKETVDELNRQFGNSLISINMDITAMPSVLANIDTLVTLPNMTCSVANAMDVNIIETLNPNTSSMVTTSGSHTIEVTSQEELCDDVIFLLNQQYGTILPMATKNSSNKVFSKVRDDIGVLKTLVRGELNLSDELSYHITRSYHYSLLGYEIDTRLIENLRANVKNADLMEYVTTAKEDLTSVTKTLLATLRSLQAAKQSDKNTSRFIQYLDQLMAFGKEENIAQAPVCMFEAAIENIVFQDPQRNMAAIEGCLYELKSDLQIMAKIFEALISKKDQGVQKEL